MRRELTETLRPTAMNTETPITDDVFAGWLKSHPARISHAKLERKLNAERELAHALAEVLRGIAVTSSSSRIKRISKEAFAKWREATK